jgi:probable HAF family extracellular repeat protein
MKEKAVYPDHSVKRRAPILLGAALMTVIALGCGGDPASPERLPPQREISDIGGASVLDGWATAVNSAGHVVGRMLLTPNGGYYHAFLWTLSGGMRDLGAIAGTLGHSTAEAINDRGQIVGVSGGRAFLWTARGGMRDLGTPPGGTGAGAADISKDGRVVGYWLPAGGGARPFVWTDAGGMRDLAVPAGLVSTGATGINSHGQIVGYGCSEPCTGAVRALLWSPSGEVQDLGTLLGVPDSRALGINDAGQVVGAIRFDDGRRRAFLWTAATGMRDLGVLPGMTDSEATAISDEGHVVGASGAHAFLWTERGGMRDLERLPSQRQESRAHAVNRFGQAVGYSRLDNVLRPVLFPTAP